MEKCKINFTDKNKQELVEYLKQYSNCITSSEMIETNLRQYVFILKNTDEEAKIIINVEKNYYNYPELKEIDSYVKGHIKVQNHSTVNIKYTIAKVVIATGIITLVGLGLKTGFDDLKKADEEKAKENQALSQQIYGSDPTPGEISEANEEYKQRMLESGEAITDSQGNIILIENSKTR